MVLLFALLFFPLFAFIAMFLSNNNAVLSWIDLWVDGSVLCGTGVRESLAEDFIYFVPRSSLKRHLKTPTELGVL